LLQSTYKKIEVEFLRLGVRKAKKGKCGKRLSLLLLSDLVEMKRLLFLSLSVLVALLSLCCDAKVSTYIKLANLVEGSTMCLVNVTLFPSLSGSTKTSPLAAPHCVPYFGNGKLLYTSLLRDSEKERSGEREEHREKDRLRNRDKDREAKRE
jgi:hypothetical protein